MKNLFISILITVVLFFSSITDTRSPNLTKEVRHAKVEQLRKEICKELRYQTLLESEFSVDNLSMLLDYHSVKNKSLIIAQFALESRWFKSELFKESNNISGMKVPKVRETLCIGSKNGFAVYNSWTDSVLDYLLLMEYNMNKGYCVEDHIAYLVDTNYCPSDGYTDLLIKVEESLIKKFIL
jgi:uncharacterized FlgJ-related protein